MEIRTTTTSTTSVQRRENVAHQTAVTASATVVQSPTAVRTKDGDGRRTGAHPVTNLSISFLVISGIMLYAFLTWAPTALVRVP